jgi:hypothetical protein
MNVIEARELLKQAAGKTYPISRALTSPLGALVSGGLSGATSGVLVTARHGPSPEAAGIGGIIGAIAGMFGSGSVRKQYAMGLADEVRAGYAKYLEPHHLEVVKAIEKARLKVAAFIPLALAPMALNYALMDGLRRRALLGRIAKGGGSLIQSERDLVKVVQTAARRRIVRKAALATAAVGAAGYGASRLVASDTDS